MLRIPREQYADMYGPTTGDQLRLADTNLWIEIEIVICAPINISKQNIAHFDV